MDAHDVDGDGFGDNLERLTFDESFNCDAFEDITPAVVAELEPHRVHERPLRVLRHLARERRRPDRPAQRHPHPDRLRGPAQLVARRHPGHLPRHRRRRVRVLLAPGPSPGPADTIDAVVAAPPTPTQLTFDGQPKQQADWGRQPGATLTVSTVGRGRVKSNPAGIACGRGGRSCTAVFADRVTVTLTAKPGNGYRFVRWTGACTGTDSTCTVNLRRSKRVTAVFEVAPSPG